jgi:hypothetical protein
VFRHQLSFFDSKVTVPEAANLVPLDNMLTKEEFVAMMRIPAEEIQPAVEHNDENPFFRYVGWLETVDVDSGRTEEALLALTSTLYSEHEQSIVNIIKDYFAASIAKLKQNPHLS